MQKRSIMKRLPSLLVLFGHASATWEGSSVRGTSETAHGNTRPKGINFQYGEPNMLIASMGPYPGYDGPLDVSGIVSVRFEEERGRGFLFHVDVRGLERDATGGVHIHVGKTCDDADRVGDHFWNEKRTEDLWTPEGGALWHSDGYGASVSSFRLYNGYGPKRNEGRAVVIHASDGTRVSCGILKANDYVLGADIGRYPRYSGNSERPLSEFAPRGRVEVHFDPDGTFEFRYGIVGVQKNCRGCGIHVHEGTTCEDHDEVGGHYYTQEAGDLWTDAGGAVYKSDRYGKARGSFHLYDGFTFTEHVGHAVVVHEQGGARIGCGVLVIESR